MVNIESIKTFLLDVSYCKQRMLDGNLLYLLFYLLILWRVSCRSFLFSFGVMFAWSFIAAPYWIRAPLNLVLAPLETGVLTCIAGGSPKPTISWFMNGVPIESQSMFLSPILTAVFILWEGFVEINRKLPEWTCVNIIVINCEFSFDLHFNLLMVNIFWNISSYSLINNNWNKQRSAAESAILTSNRTENSSANSDLNANISHYISNLFIYCWKNITINININMQQLFNRVKIFLVASK